MSVTRKIFSGVLWVGGGVAGQALSQLVVLMILARVLSPEEFGVVTAVAVIAGIGLMFSQMGVGPAIVRKEKLSEEDIRAGVWISVVLSVLAAIALIYLRADIARFLNIGLLADIVPYLSLIFISRGMSVVSESLLNRELKFDVIARIEFFSYVLGYGATGVFLAINGYSYWSLIIAQIVQATLLSVLYLVIRPPLIMPIAKFSVYRDLFEFGVGVTIVRLSNYFALQSDKIIISKYLGETALGFYGRASQLSIMPVNLVGKVVQIVSFAVLSSIQSDSEKLKGVYQKLLVSVSIITLPITAFLFAVREEVILVVLGVKWINVVPVFEVMVVSILFRMTYRVSGSMLTAVGRVYKRAVLQVIFAVLAISFAYIGSSYGLVGVATGMLVATIVNTLMTFQLSLVETHSSWMEGIRFLLSGARLALASTLPVVLLDLYLSELGINVFCELAILSLVWIVSLVLILALAPNLVLKGVGLEILNTIIGSVRPIIGSSFSKRKDRSELD